MAPTENNAKGPSVLLIDSNQMRRAGIASLLAVWAGPLGIAIREASPAEILREFDDGARWQLVLLSVGGESISHGEYGTLMRVLPALAGPTPLVVIADNEVADEILVAYRCGCGGYVPTSMDPRLALQALGFIMNGGFFFPPSALRLIEGSGDDPDDAGTPGPGRVRRSISITARSEVRDMPGSNGEPRAKSRPKRNIVETELEDAVSENGLTMRQQQVLDHLRNGMSNKLIARALSLTEGTVKVHVRQIMRKFNATNRTEVAVASVRTLRVGSPTGAGELRVVETVTTMPRSAA